VPTLSAREQAAQLADQACGTAEHARKLINLRAVEADPSGSTELALSLSSTSDTLGEALRGRIGRQPALAAPLCDLLTDVTELQQDLREYVTEQRFVAMGRIHAALARLRKVDNVADLLSQAPEELCHSCDFDRALLSRVRGSTWVPEHLCIGAGQDPVVTAATEEYLGKVEIPLSPMLLETELARRGAPTLVTDPLNHPRTFKDLMTISQTREYVAAPIMPTGRVIGFLHADCFGSERDLTLHDRDNLWTFAEGFGLIFERMVLLERLDDQRKDVREAFRLAETQIEELCDAEVRLGRDRYEAEPAASNAELFHQEESRINTLLTAREREVLQIMVSGARNNQIADQLVISEGTVKSHVKNICRKLRASNRAEAVAKYLQLVIKDRA
jgi:DNA-binding CsgD family transcriptional regulator